MIYIAIAALLVALLGLVVALRSAMLGYRLHAEAIRRETANRVVEDLARIERAKLLLEYVNKRAEFTGSEGVMELPSLTEMENSLKEFSSRHGERSVSEVVGMRTTDFAVLQSIRESLLVIERRLDVLAVVAKRPDEASAI